MILCKLSDFENFLWAFAPLKIFTNDISIIEKIVLKEDKSLLTTIMNQWLFLKIKLKLCMQLVNEDKFYFIIGLQKSNMLKENRKLLKLIENF